MSIPSLSSSAASSGSTPISYPNQGLIVAGTGLSSGIDYTTLLNAIDKSLSEPITLMKDQESPLNNELSAWGKISSAASNLNSAAAALGQTSLFSTYSAASSDPSVATATASSSAIPGTYSLSVSALATKDVMASQGVAATSTAVSSSGATGTYDITVNGKTTDVALNSSTGYTLADLSQAINNSGAGVSASIINNGSSTDPYQLVLTSDNTGTNNDISVTDPTLAASSTATALTFSTTQAAQNASLSYGGISITSQSNTVNNVIPGVTLNLASTGSTTVTVGLDTNAIDSAVNNFVSSYNSLLSDVSSQQTYNTSNKSTGPLGGNPALSSLVNSLYSFMGSEAPGMTGSSGLPSTYGITENADGSGQLQLNTTTLNSMLTSNPQQVQQFFSALVNGSPTADGVSEKGGMTNFLDSYTNPANGVIYFEQQQINSQLKNMNSQIASQTAMVQEQMGMYVKQFAALEQYVGEMKTTSAALASQIGQMPSTTSAGG
jgi:flagellar hook-associated protein 2